MTERSQTSENWGYAAFVLTSAAAAVKGEVACIDTSTGKVTVGGTSTTLMPVGWFHESKTGDGSATVQVRLFREVVGAWWSNDSDPNAVDSGDIGSTCYIKDGSTVSASSASSTRSVAGRVWAVSSTRGVLVEAGAAVTGPTGTSGVGSGKVATRAALTAIAAAGRHDGQLVMVQTDGSLWRFVAASSVTVDGAGELALAPDVGTGRWLRADKACVLKLPIAYTTADAAALCTVPSGMVLRLAGMPFWEVTTGFTGGTNSAIGLSASAIATTKGDLLGGASGQLTAVLGTSGVKPGTIGPLIDTLAEQQAFVLVGADYLRFDRIASVYTAGAGFICVPVSIMTAA